MLLNLNIKTTCASGPHFVMQVSLYMNYCSAYISPLFCLPCSPPDTTGGNVSPRSTLCSPSLEQWKSSGNHLRKSPSSFLRGIRYVIIVLLACADVICKYPRPSYRQYSSLGQVLENTKVLSFDFSLILRQSHC